jgi:HlyD family secretion protein
LAAAQPDSSSEDQLARLRDQESELYTEYSRLAGETYSDAYYQDRLRLAHNAFLEAQDSRIRSELQQQISLTRAQMKARQAGQKLADAQENLADAVAGVDALDLAEAQQAVAQAQADLADARAARAELDEGPDAVKLAAAQADVDKKQLAVSEAEADLAGATLAAPFAGTVLQTNAEPGDRITAASQILTLANLEELQVLASIDETTIRQVSAGQPATITFDAFPGQTFRGEVLAVPLQGTLQGGIMVYEAPISLVGAEDLPLLVGMTANVAIQTGQAEDVLLVPTMALQTVNGLYQVLVPSSDPAGEPVSVPVEIGLSNGTYTEIVRGLNPGDQVVVQLSSSDSEGFFGMGPGGGMDFVAAPGGPPAGGAPPNRPSN